MNPAATPSSIAPADQDLAEQARPGHGIPSQDPNPAAQYLQSPEDTQHEVKSALVGGGVVAGLATGAAIGAAVAGPIGVAVGTALGAVVGALGGVATGAAVQQETNAGADTTEP